MTSAQPQAPTEWWPRPPGAPSGRGHTWVDEYCWHAGPTRSLCHLPTPSLQRVGSAAKITLLKKLGGKLRIRAGSALPKVTPCQGVLLCGRASEV